MRKIQVLALTLVACVALTSAASATTVITYAPADGNLNAANAVEGITTLEIKSAGGNFVPGNAAPGVFLPPFDTINANKLFVLKTDGFNDINFGNVVTPGLNIDQLGADMSIDGSLKQGGGLAGDGPGPSEGLDIVVVPEPGSIALIGFGLLGLLSFRRKR